GKQFFRQRKICFGESAEHGSRIFHKKNNVLQKLSIVYEDGIHGCRKLFGPFCYHPGPLFEIQYDVIVSEEINIRSGIFYLECRRGKKTVPACHAFAFHPVYLKRDTL